MCTHSGGTPSVFHSWSPFLWPMGPGNLCTFSEAKGTPGERKAREHEFVGILAADQQRRVRPLCRGAGSRPGGAAASGEGGGGGLHPALRSLIQRQQKRSQIPRSGQRLQPPWPPHQLGPSHGRRHAKHWLHADPARTQNKSSWTSGDGRYAGPG